MKRALSVILWGCIITVFHINLGVITILPGFIGVLIFTVGIYQLRSRIPSKELNAAGIFALLYCGYSITFFFISMTQADESVSLGHGFRISLAVSILAQIIEMAVFVLLFLALSTCFKAKGDSHFSRILGIHMWTYLGLEVAVTFYLAACIQLPSNFAIAGLFAAFFIKLYCILILAYGRYCINQYKTEATKTVLPEATTDKI